MTNNPFRRFLDRNGVSFSVERNSVQIATIKGLPNHDSTQKAYIGVLPNTDIRIHDVLINHFQEHLYVIDIQTAFIHGEPSQLKVYYLTEGQKLQSETEETKTVFNISSVSNSVIGNNNCVYLDYSQQLNDLKKQVESHTSSDRNNLEEIVSLLEKVVNNQMKPSQGLFSKFSAVMERHSWLTNSVCSVLMSWLMSQIG